MKPSRRRPVVGYLRGAYRVSERRACGMVRLPRATPRYQTIRDPLTELRLRMGELAQSRIRYGYRKIRVLLIREGWPVGKKLLYRLNREGGLGLRTRRKSRRTVSEHRRQELRAERPNQIWSLDFVADQLVDGLDAHCCSTLAEAGQRIDRRKLTLGLVQKKGSDHMIDALTAASGKIAGAGSAAERLDLKRTMVQNKARRLKISGPTTRSDRFAYTPESNSMRS